MARTARKTKTDNIDMSGWTDEEVLKFADDTAADVMKSGVKWPGLGPAIDARDKQIGALEERRINIERNHAKRVQEIGDTHSHELWRIYENYVGTRDRLDAEYSSKTRNAGLMLIVALVGSFFLILFVGGAVRSGGDSGGYGRNYYSAGYD